MDALKVSSVVSAYVEKGLSAEREGHRLEALAEYKKGLILALRFLAHSVGEDKRRYYLSYE